MNRPRRWAGPVPCAVCGAGAAIAAAVLLTLPPAASSRAEPSSAWPEGRATAIRVEGGRCRFSVPSGSSSERTLLVVSALTRHPGVYPVRIRARSADRADPPRTTSDGPGRSPRLLPPPREPEGPVPAMPPPRDRRFAIPVRDGDAASPSNHAEILATLAAYGDRTAVYVDPADAASLDRRTIRDMIATFEDHVLPRARAEIGTARDVDGDGRFAILVSRWLGHLADGRLSVDGFVRGADFEPGLAPPLGNRADMMYLNVGLRSGPHLRTVIAHEYTHAVTFCRKALGPSGRDEEGWLDEALAHLGEDLHGFSRSNLDYRVEAFLARPSRYRLLVDDYGTPDLIRSHGHRGSAYLFLRWCADRYGPALLGTLVRSDLRGVEALEAATGAPFASLYRAWSVSWARDGVAGDGPSGRIAPRREWLAPGEEATLRLDGTTTQPVVVEGSPRGAVEIEVEGPAGADLQVTAVRLPADLPRVGLSAAIESDASGNATLRARVRGWDPGEVRFESLRWGPAVPTDDPEDRASLTGRLDGDELARALGGEGLEGRAHRASRPIPIAPRVSGPLAVTLILRDRAGRQVMARDEAALPAIRPEDEGDGD